MTTEITQLTNNNSANLIFDLINRAEAFGDKQIDIIIVNNEPWFKGKDIAVILGYDNTTKAIRDNIDIEDRKSLDNILKVRTGDTHPNYNKNQLKTIYINESGLYSLIMNSKLPTAKQFKKWVTSELLPKIRKNGQEALLKQISEQKEQLNRLHTINVELLTYKKLTEKNETIYIVSSYNLIKNGLLKVGRTKNLKARNSTHNTTHPAGDKIKVLKEFKVNDATLVESVIHKKLAGLRPDKDSEFFMCPYDLLQSIIELIVDNDSVANDAVNKIIDTVYMLKQQVFNSLDWMKGVPEDTFNDVINPINIKMTDKTLNFNIENATDEQLELFIKQCIEIYKQVFLQPNQSKYTIEWPKMKNIILDNQTKTKTKAKVMPAKKTLKKIADICKLAISWQ